MDDGHGVTRAGGALRACERGMAPTGSRRRGRSLAAVTRREALRARERGMAPTGP
ncbi:hypothetical protein [Streptomyces sp. NPDC018833]|uniref:hypothetical protein n=1 Tax=Streptomyces sp. NPDC018833 TaxID=3365053 RepID=UPI00378EE510